MFNSRRIRPYHPSDLPAVNALREAAGLAPLQAHALACGMSLIYEQDGMIAGTVSAIYQGAKAYGENLVALNDSPYIASQLIDHLLTLLRFVNVQTLVFVTNPHFAALSERFGSRRIEDTTTLFYAL